MPVTSETTFMNSPLIINVEGGGLAFDLARHRGALYLARRRKLLLIYEDTLPLCVTSYLVLLPRGEQSCVREAVKQIFQEHFCQKTHATNNIYKGTMCVYSVSTGLIISYITTRTSVLILYLLLCLLR